MTLVISQLTKQYGATCALDQVSLEVKAGSVHALLGHNGAGKSTLIKCLGGGVRPTSGKITLDGKNLIELTPKTSILSGIAVIYQNLSLIDALSVSDNLFLGREIKGRLNAISRRTQREMTHEALERVNSLASPDDIVGGLSMGQKQLVEISKALLRDAKLLILDEPSAALSLVESRKLLEVIRGLQKQNMKIIYVTHLLNEVKAIADVATVLRNGKVVWSQDMENTSKSELVAAISDGEQERQASFRGIDISSAPLIKVNRFQGCGVGPVSFSVQPGEIIGLYGLIGSGRSRLLEMLFGRLTHDGGTVEVEGKIVDLKNPISALNHAIALVPADRVKQGLFGSLTAKDNVALRFMSTSKGGLFRSFSAERGVFAEMALKFSLAPDMPNLEVNRFSGGNAQKILISRWVYSDSPVKVLLLDDPTQGVDVKARQDIYSVIRLLAEKQNMAVIFASNEPEEIMALANKCWIMSKGFFTEEIDVSTIDEEKLLEKIYV